MIISHARKEMLKILQTRLQHYMNRELPDVQSRFRKGRGTIGQIANIQLDHRKTSESQKKNLLLLNEYTKTFEYAKIFDCGYHNKLWKILKDMGIPNHLTCLLRNLSPGQEATVRTEHGTMDWF